MQYEHINVPHDGAAITINRDHSARLRAAMHQPIRKARPQDREGVDSVLEQLIPGATLVGTRGFGDPVMRHMDD